MSVTYRQWRGREIRTTDDLAWFHKRTIEEKRGGAGLGSSLLTELVRTSQRSKLFFDLDAHISGEKELPACYLRMEKLIDTILSRYGGRECMIVDFSGARDIDGQIDYKFSVHLIFPELVCSWAVLSKYRKRNLLEKAFSSEEMIDPAVYSSVRMFRQWGLVKPDKTCTKIVAPGGDAFIWQKGQGSTPADINDLNLFSKSLISYIAGDVIDITDSLKTHLGSLPPTSLPRTQRGRPATTGDSNIPEVFLKQFDRFKKEEKDRMLETARIFWQLPEAYGQHDGRIPLYPAFKAFERVIGVPEGDFYMEWLAHIREDLSKRDYLENYKGAGFNPELAPNPHLVADGLKYKHDLLTLPDEIAIDKAQTDFKNGSVKPTLHSLPDLFSFVLKLAGKNIMKIPGATRDDAIKIIFSHVCLTYEDGHEMITCKTLNQLTKTVEYKSFRRDRTMNPLTKRLFIDAPDKPKVSFFDLFPTCSPLFVQEAGFYGPWVADSSKLNLSPQASVWPERSANYEEWFAEFKDYMLSVFFGRETNKEEGFACLMAWYKHLIFADTPTEVLVVLTSREGGLGKSLLFNDIPAYIMRSEYVRIIKESLKIIVDGFNDFSTFQKLICLEESENYGGVDGRTFDALKELVTSRTLQIKKKYKPLETVPNRSNFVLMSNNPRPILTGLDDRRCMFFNLKDPFKSRNARKREGMRFAKLMKNNLANFVWFLKNEAEDWDTWKETPFVSDELIAQGQFKKAVTMSKYASDLLAGMEAYHIEKTQQNPGVKYPFHIFENQTLRFSSKEIRDLIKREAGVNMKLCDVIRESLKIGFNIPDGRVRFLSSLGNQCQSQMMSVKISKLEEYGIPFDLAQPSSISADNRKFCKEYRREFD